MSCHCEKIFDVTNILKVGILAQEHIVIGFTDCGPRTRQKTGAFINCEPMVRQRAGTFIRNTSPGSREDTEIGEWIEYKYSKLSIVTGNRLFVLATQLSLPQITTQKLY